MRPSAAQRRRPAPAWGSKDSGRVGRARPTANLLQELKALKACFLMPKLRWSTKNRPRDSIATGRFWSSMIVRGTWCKRIQHVKAWRQRSTSNLVACTSAVDLFSTVPLIVPLAFQLLLSDQTREMASVEQSLANLVKWSALFPAPT